MLLEQQFQVNITPYIQESSIAIAVSAGCDSIALFLLFRQWAEFQDIKITIIYVDHNLRPESKDELDFVRNLAEQYGAEFIGLKWDHENNMSNIQARAREARYNLMVQVLEGRNIRTLLTAHHQDDMIETYLMRKVRNEGIFGLKSSFLHFRNNVRIIRPLYNIAKSELISYLEYHKINWLEDSSNLLDKYERNRVRKIVSNFDKQERIGILNEMELVSKQVALQNKKLINAIAESTYMDNFGFAKIDLSKLKNYDFEIKFQLLSYILTIISGSIVTPRSRNLKPLIDKLNEYFTKKFQKFHHTLHGCELLINQHNNLIIFREYAAISLKNSILNGDKILWDQRLQISFSELFHNLLKNDNSDAGGLFISKLTMADYQTIYKKIDSKEYQKLQQLSDNCHKKILFTFPVVKRLEKVIAIPHISYYSLHISNIDAFDDSKIAVLFKPNFLSRFTHFI